MRLPVLSTRCATMVVMEEPKAITATITGRVQGVGFRFATARFARDRSITGWVRNTAHGAVETWAQGDEAELDRLLVFLRTGPPAADVTSVTVLPSVPDPAIRSFNVRY